MLTFKNFRVFQLLVFTFFLVNLWINVVRCCHTLDPHFQSIDLKSIFPNLIYNV